MQLECPISKLNFSNMKVSIKRRRESASSQLSTNVPSYHQTPKYNPK